LDSVLAARPKVVSLSFGDPAPFVQRVKDAGAVVISQINSVEDLREVEAAGVDAVVAQGGEAGGHTGRIATLPLLQEV
ncbi:nitronate monooxygenase, partial [Mycobacterium kansasii]